MGVYNVVIDLNIAGFGYRRISRKVEAASMEMALVVAKTDLCVVEVVSADRLDEKADIGTEPSAILESSASSSPK